MGAGESLGGGRPAEVARVPGQRVGPGSAGAPSGRLRLLLVEDDDGDAYLVRELLAEAQAAVDLTVATTLAEARARVAGVDCVLLDLGLPDAHGLDGLRRLLEVASGAAVCVLTGLGDEGIGAAAVAEGAQDYLIKGQVDGVILARSVRYAVERKKADENARRLHEIQVLQRESERLERGLLPKPLLRTTDMKVDTFYQSGRGAQAGRPGQLGGDFYDVVQTSPRRLAMMVGDVCGHGVDEAALGVELRVAWRALTLAGVDDDAVLPAIEQVLVSERKNRDVFATLATVSVDLASGEAAVRLAGHPPPVLLAEGSADSVPAVHGAVLGVLDDAVRPASRVLLGGGDWALLMYTDGLIEGRSGGREQRLGVNGLHALLTSPEANAIARKDLGRWLVARAEDANGGPLADDVAMLVLSPVHGGPHTRGPQ